MFGSKSLICDIMVSTKMGEVALLDVSPRRSRSFKPDVVSSSSSEVGGGGEGSPAPPTPLLAAGPVVSKHQIKEYHYIDSTRARRRYTWQRRPDHKSDAI
eukprot:TRINITY_DN7975_c0_g1_i2.p3 TRINITY_DN7975_c0_g1~~TRINITY_DN7975_c0_g1_i2.p3  ORF type:complete len:100 (+),score=7.00 TRINITY_DN7975_c0_g1_i2:681-980(+)